MLISLSPTILDAGQLFKDRCAGSKSAVQSQRLLIHKRAPLSKLIHNRTSTDSVARLLRWYKNKLLSDAEKDQEDSLLLEVASLVNYGEQLFETLQVLSEQAQELECAFNALPPEDQEYEKPRIEQELQAIDAKQERIHALLDNPSEESLGLLQQLQARDQKLSLIEQTEEPHATSLVEYLFSMPRTETVICTIAGVVTAVGIGLQLPLVIWCVSIFVSIAMAVLRLVNFKNEDKRHAKNNNVLILRKEVIGFYMKILENLISAVFQIKQDTTDIKGTLGRIENQSRRLEQKFDNAPPAITHNTYNVINVVDPRHFLPIEQQLFLAQGIFNTTRYYAPWGGARTNKNSARSPAKTKERFWRISPRPVFCW